MRGIHLFLILASLPFLAALSHDIYLFVTNGGSVDSLQESLNAGEDEPGLKKLFASVGYIWTHYSPDTYKSAVENTDEETWKTINKILAQKAVVVGGLFAAFFGVLALIAKMLGVGAAQKAETKFGGRKGSFNVEARQKYKGLALLCYIFVFLGLLPLAAIIGLCMLGPSKGAISRSHFNNMIYITVVAVISGLVIFFGLLPLYKSGESVLSYSAVGISIGMTIYLTYRWLFGLMALLRGETFKEN